MASRKQKLRVHSRFARWWRRFEYKHTLLALGAVGGFVLALDTALIQALLLTIREIGLPGIFIAGILFVSFFTATPALAILIASADNYNPWVIASVAGIGSVIGDWIILKVIKDNVGYEMVPLAKKFGLMPFVRLIRSRPMRPIALLLGAFIVASPFPDEAGIALLGLSHLKISKILLITFMLNSVGIYAIVWGARSLVTQI